MTAVRQKASRILAAGFSKEVIFEPVEGSVLDSIDEAPTVRSIVAIDISNR